jgi:hypothetical protein
VPPGKLFRLLLRRPRPVLRIDYRLDVASHVTLYAQALTAPERAIVQDAEPAECDSLYLWLSLVDVAGAPVFAHREQTHHLQDHEVEALIDAVVKAHRVIAPSQNTCDYKAWQEALVAGAKDPYSFAMVQQIRHAATRDAQFKKPFQPRPDLYFGLPLADITDGQRMAFLAAFELLYP